MKSIDDKKVKDILLRESYLSVEDIQKAETSSGASNTSFVDHILAESLITKELLGQAIAESFEVPYVDLNIYNPQREQVLRIPEEIAKKYNLILLKEDKNEVILTTTNPKQSGLAEVLQPIFQTKKITLSYSLPEDVEKNFIYYRKPLKTRFTKIIESQKRIAPEILGSIFDDAFAFNASDIHFEPQDDSIIIRFRVDGVLHEAGRLPKKYHENILNRVKVRAHLRIDEHFAAQDGSIRHKNKGKIADFRVSIVPTIHGEKIVMRILAQYVRGFALNDLGLSARDQGILQKAAKKPFGMILVTGPTGSGKTTTLYALLKLLNSPEVNITTIEDPVEYRMQGINQIQVNPDTNLTFAQGLRSVVRQDPDIILVGEIRDDETVEISVNAALTGHILLSTFHANDASTAIPRLLDMKTEPFLLASTLEVIIAQRLMRRICNSCRYSIKVTKKDIQKLSQGAGQYFDESTSTLYKGKGCFSCGDTGFKGRIAIFEFIEITAEMQDMILENPSAQQIWKLAESQGANSLFADGVLKVKNGITTLEELLRVAAPPYVSKKREKKE